MLAELQLCARRAGFARQEGPQIHTSGIHYQKMLGAPFCGSGLNCCERVRPLQAGQNPWNREKRVLGLKQIQVPIA